jgi:hypothetical protein
MNVFQKGMAVAALMFWPSLAVAQLQLVMFEQVGCSYCARWTREIGPIYPLTTEGKAAPLRRIDIHDPLPDDITLTRPAVFTPTFVLVLEGAEQGRLEGYISQDFFWGLLAQMIDQTKVALPVNSE